VVLFEGKVQLKLNPETKMNPSISALAQHNLRVWLKSSKYGS